MPKKKHPLKFDLVKARLQELREQAILDLHTPGESGNALNLKRQIEAAIQCLEFCEKYQIQPNSQVTELPDTKTRTPSSNYRICEDHESSHMKNWEELKIDGRPFYLYEGYLVISRY